MKDKELIVSVKNLSKSFQLPHEKHSGLKQYLINIFKRNQGFEIQHVLKSVSFDINKGDFFGIVGRNGSGKSTLLKLLSGIYTPGKGTIDIRGTLTPFIELGVGFNGELTGRENVYMNGAMLGFSRKEMDAMYDDIVDFSEIEKFMDQKLKNYSSGMQVRLAFSIAIRANTDILVLDEVLAVGDAAFQQKCFDYFEKMKRDKKTIIFVTHDMSAVKRFCNKAIIIEDGKIKKRGTPNEIADQYILDNIDTSNKSDSKQGNNSKFEADVSKLIFELKSAASISHDEQLIFSIKYELKDAFLPMLGFTISKSGISVCEMNSKNIILSNQVDKLHEVEFKMDLKSFNPGAYKIDIAIFNEYRSVRGYKLSAAHFVIKGEDQTRGGIIRSDGDWKVVK